MKYWQTCEACAVRFLSRRKQARFCPSCAEEIKTKTTELKSLLDLNLSSPERTVLDTLRESLTCHEDSKKNFPARDASECEWSWNLNRLVPNDRRLLSDYNYTGGFAIALLKHQMKHRFPGRFPVSRQFTPRWLVELNQWEEEPSKEPVEFVWKAMLRVYAGGTREQPMTTPAPPNIPPDPEAERLIAERKAKGLIGEKTTAELFAAGMDSTNPAQEEWENFLATKPRFPELERLIAERESERIIAEGAAAADQTKEQAGRPS